ncbi:hypothetical protein [Parvularcula marina]|uniref:Oligosaccharide repeat unit polymerase n=1 Tax=Parvularcula marina TaxID=2292771 RepID=A0A371RI28_9PROT|nr:hypothetical protein [Parvularcula marina]RFB05091.1 hypothetical protein DX908_07180 [Parvularcula marina]
MSTELLITYGLTLGLLVIAIRNAHGIHLMKFPFLFAGVFVAFVLFQLIAIIQSGSYVYEVYRNTGVVSTTLILLTGSSIFGLAGYYLARPKVRRERPLFMPPTRRQERFLDLTSAALGIIAIIAFFMLARIGGGVRNYLLSGGFYSIYFEGLPTYLVFVIRFTYVSIVIQMWLWARTRKMYHLYLGLFFGLIPMMNVLFLFRRTEVLTLGIFYGYFIINYTRIRLGRIAAVGAIAGMMVAMRLFPLLRTEEGRNSDISDLFAQALSSRETFENTEIAGAMYRIYSTSLTQYYEYGSIFWNAFVQQFVPASLVGSATKQGLFLRQSEFEFAYFTEQLNYLSPMGFSQAFQQFGYYGMLLFGLIGIWVAKLEQSRYGTARGEIFLVLMVPALLLIVGADLSLIVSKAITFGVLVYFCVPARTGLLTKKADRAARSEARARQQESLRASQMVEGI